MVIIMLKRTERNKKLYEDVNKEIARRAKAHSNEAFKATSNTLKSIDPDLFGGSKTNTFNQKSVSSKKKLKTSIILFVSLVIVVILLIVGIYYGTK